MNYQNLLSEAFPYVAQIYPNCNFELHRHYEIEIIYCLSGSFMLKTKTDEFFVNSGEIIIISSMLPHEAKSFSAEDNNVLLIKIGPAFLRDAFYELASITFSNPVFKIDGNKEKWLKKLHFSFKTLTKYCRNRTQAAELIVMGTIYQLCANIMNDIPAERKIVNSKYSEYKSVAKIENVLEYIYLHYDENITIEKAASVAGYSKGSFCKIFKNTTGSSFHTYLNNFRIKNARFLLSETTIPIGEISCMVGFSEPKTFCRIYKKITGETPSEYRQHELKT